MQDTTNVNHFAAQIEPYTAQSSNAALIQLVEEMTDYGHQLEKTIPPAGSTEERPRPDHTVSDGFRSDIDALAGSISAELRDLLDAFLQYLIDLEGRVAAQSSTNN
ncbi:MAG: hypothetical protein AAFW73_22495 [Bacteroidota bacterium]